MKEKYTFKKLAFSNLKWGLAFSVLLIAFWFVAFFEEKPMMLPVIENTDVENQVNQSVNNYVLSNARTAATLETNVNFIKKLFFTRPIFNLDFITCLFILFVSFFIYRFIRNVEKELDFKNKTHQIFYWIGISCLLYCTACAITINLANHYILALTNNQYRLKWSLENSLIIAIMGYFFFVLGYSFKKGFTLQQEQDLTV